MRNHALVKQVNIDGSVWAKLAHIWG